MGKRIIARGNNSYTKRLSLKDIIEIKDKIIFNTSNSYYDKEEKINYLKHTLSNQPNKFIELIYVETLDKYLLNEYEDNERLKCLIEFLDDKIKFVYDIYNDYDCKNKTFSQIDKELRKFMLDIIEVDFNILPLEKDFLIYEDIVNNLKELEYENYCNKQSI